MIKDPIGKICLGRFRPKWKDCTKDIKTIEAESIWRKDTEEKIGWQVLYLAALSKSLNHRKKNDYNI